MSVDELLTTDLWKRIATLARRAKSRQAALAYVTSEHVRFGKGDILIADASPAAIKSGQTSAAVLLAAHRRGAEVYSCPNLHAKVIVLEGSAIIGSANLSTHSAEHLAECAVLTRQPALVGQARAYLQQLQEASESLSLKKLQALRALPVVTPKWTKRAGKLRLPSLGSRRWIVGVTPDPVLSDEDEAIAEKALIKLEREHARKKRELESLYLVGPSRMRREARVGDRMILAWGQKRDATRLKIDPPRTILSRVEGVNGLFLFYDVAEDARAELSKTDFTRLQRGTRSPIVPSTRMIREVRSEVFAQWEEHWPS
jgi:hypothetical protein